MSKLFFWLIRFVFGVYFFLYGVKGLGDLAASNSIAVNHLNVMQEKIEQLLPNAINFSLVKEHMHTVFQMKNLALSYGGLMMLFGGATGKYFSFLALSVEMVLLASPRVIEDEMSYCSFSAYIALIGASLSV